MKLYKLKKDGKCVGYLKIEYSDIWHRTDGIWHRVRHEIDFDEALPYVTDDKDGDKVFAGDKMTDLLHTYELKWQESSASYILIDIEEPMNQLFAGAIKLLAKEKP